MNIHKSSTNLVVIEPKDVNLDDITIALPQDKTISILAATYENYNVKVITQTNNEEEKLITNIIAVKKGDDLVVTAADASKVIFRGFYTLCDTDGACTVTLGGEKEGVTITPDSLVGEALSDGSFMVYTYADSGLLADMLTEVDGDTLGLSDLPEGTVSYIPIADEKTNYQETNDQGANDEGTHWWWVAGGIALAAVGIKVFNDSDNNVNTPTTGTVTISGTATENQRLTAVTSTLADADGIGSFTYQWWAGDEAIADATSTTLTLTQAQVGKIITVTVIHTDALGTVEPTITSAATAAVENVNDLTMGAVTITGTAAEDQTLTAVTSALADADGVGTFTYQWWADGEAIADATNATLTLMQAQVGKTITVTVTHTDALGTVEPAKASAPTAMVANVNDPTTGTVAIKGTAEEDQNLTADTSALADADGLGTFTYQWWAGDYAITGATSATLSLTQAQVGKTITLKVMYTDAQGTLEAITSVPTTAVVNVNDPTTGTVAIKGTAEEDQTLTADTSALADADGVGSFTYQWQADNVVIAGETEKTLMLTQAQVGKNITVVVIHTDALGTVEPAITSAVTAMVANVNDPTVGAVIITGTPVVGEALMADTDELTDDNGLGEFSYQWLAGSDVIASATEKTLTLTKAHVGKTITVVVIHTDELGNVEPEITSEETVTIRELGTMVAITSATDDVGSVTGLLANGDSTDDNSPALAGTISSVLLAGEVVAIYDGTTRLGEAEVTGDTGTDWAFAINPAIAFGFGSEATAAAVVESKVLTTANSIIRNTLDEFANSGYVGSYSADQPLTGDVTISAISTGGLNRGAFGFSAQDNSKSSSYVADYAWFVVSNKLSIVEGVPGTFINNFGHYGTYETGDILSLQRTGTTVDYLLNGVVLYSSEVTSVGALHLDISLGYTTHVAIPGSIDRLYTEGAGFENIDIGSSSLSAGNHGLFARVENDAGQLGLDSTIFNVNFSVPEYQAAQTMGNTLTLTFDQPLFDEPLSDVTVPAVPAVTAFTVEVDGSVRDVTEVAIISGNNVVLIFNGAEVINTASVSYTPPSSGDVLENVQGNAAAAFNNIIVGTSGDNTLMGTNSADIITGNAGDDIITGNGGTDTLTGGAGSDIFDYNDLEDTGDTITDFTIGVGGDQLDLSDLLTYQSGGDDVLSRYLTVTDDGTDVTVVADRDAFIVRDGVSVNGTLTVSITLQGIGTGALTLADLETDNIIVAEVVL